METIKKMQAMNYENVSLKDSFLKQQFDETKEYYFSISNDGLLYGFRKRAGLETPGEQLSGWYGHGVGHVFGQILGTIAKLYKITGDHRFKEKSDILFNGWKQCVEPDGYGLYNPKGRVSDIFYEFEKLLGGLLDTCEYTGNREALKYAEFITEWTYNNVNKKIKHEKIYFLSNEWYTIPENLYRAYQLSGSVIFKNFAEEWEYAEYWDRFLDESFEPGVRHAYSHVNTLSSAAMAYRIKGDEKYFSILKNAYDILSQKHIYATGGYGPDEKMFGEEGYLGESLLATHLEGWGHAEIPCGSWAVFKLCRYLMEFTGDAKYGDWAEKMLYNGIGAELPLAKWGKVMYYANYDVGGAHKTVIDNRIYTDKGTTLDWPCCSGTYPHSTSEYYNLIYFKRDREVCVSQYIPSQADFIFADNKVTLQMDTRYPEESKVRLKTEAQRDTAFTLKLRVPSWVAGKVQVNINGKKTDLNAGANSWLEIERTWSDKDTVEVDFPMSLYFSAVDKEHRDIAALCYGPVVLATDLNGVLCGDQLHPSLWIEKADGEPVTFVTTPGHVKGYEKLTKTFRPFYRIGDRQWYYMYNRIER